MNLKQCPAKIGYVGSQLASLNLSNNRLVELPEEIGLLRGLEELFLQYNCLEELPVSILYHFLTAWGLPDSLVAYLCDIYSPESRAQNWILIKHFVALFYSSYVTWSSRMSGPGPKLVNHSHCWISQKRKCKNWSKYITNTRPIIYIQNCCMHSCTGVAGYRWVKDWRARGSRVRFRDETNVFGVSVSNEIGWTGKIAKKKKKKC